MPITSIIFRIDGADHQPLTALEPSANHREIQLMDLPSILGHGIGVTLSNMASLRLQPSEIAVDLILLASAVYAADKQINRKTHAQDSWTREIDIHVPVSNVDTWNGVAPTVQKALGFLTGDKWRIRFHERPQNHQRLAPEVAEPSLLMPDCVSLFSGGLDSYVGAIDLLAGGRRPLLVSHGWVKTDTHHQDLTLNHLKNGRDAGDLFHLHSRIGFNNSLLTAQNQREGTERSRSFMFFSLAALAASGLNPGTTIFVPENGLISLNIPLDPLRLGSLSTRTTHPYFISRFNDVLREIGIQAHLVNPYRHKTKGEMVRECKDQAVLQAGLADTISCSSPNKARWVPAADRPANYQGHCHCGWCVPCIIRRAAVRASGIGDPTPYLLQSLTDAPLNSRSAKGADVRSFQVAIARLNNSLRRAKVIVRETGPLSDFPGEIDQFAQMYLRGMQEVGALIQGAVVHPHA